MCHSIHVKVNAHSLGAASENYSDIIILFNDYGDWLFQIIQKNYKPVLFVLFLTSLLEVQTQKNTVQALTRKLEKW